MICLVMAGQQMTLARTCLIDICYTVYVNNKCNNLKGNTRTVSYGRALLKKILKGVYLTKVIKTVCICIHIIQFQYYSGVKKPLPNKYNHIIIFDGFSSC